MLYQFYGYSSRDGHNKNVKFTVQNPARSWSLTQATSQPTNQPTNASISIFVHIALCVILHYFLSLAIMTSSNGNIFRVTGHLCGGIPRLPVNSPHKGQWRGALMFSLLCVWINGWVNNRVAGDLRRYPAHYDVTAMCWLMVFVISFGIKQMFVSYSLAV